MNEMNNRTMPPCTVMPVLVYPEVRPAVDWLVQRVRIRRALGGEGTPRAAPRRRRRGRRRRRRRDGRVRRALDDGPGRQRRRAPRRRAAAGARASSARRPTIRTASGSTRWRTPAATAGRSRSRSPISRPRSGEARRGLVWRVAEYDAVVVGSGVNSLACGALLARAGWSVCVLERNDWLGGAIHTAEMTEPGFHHDVFSAWHPLWVGGAAHAQLGDELAARGLEYLNTDLPTATAFPDGEAAFLLRDARGECARARPGVARRARALLPERRSRVRPARHGAVVRGRRSRSRRRRCAGSAARARAAFAGELLQTSRDWLEQTFASERAHGLLAPWVLHTGLGPDAAASGFMTQVIAVAVQEGGMPIPRGGGAKLADALVRLIRDHGGVCETGARRRARRRPRRPRGRRPARGRRDGRGDARGGRQRHADAALRAAARRRRRTGARRRGRAALPLRARRDADPLRALRAARAGTATSA